MLSQNSLTLLKTFATTGMALFSHSITPGISRSTTKSQISPNAGYSMFDQKSAMAWNAALTTGPTWSSMGRSRISVLWMPGSIFFVTKFSRLKSIGWTTTVQNSFTFAPILPRMPETSWKIFCRFFVR